MQRRGGAIVAPHESGSGTFATGRGTPTMSVVGRWSHLVDATLYLKGEMECALMGQGFHRGFTAAEKTELWDRWRRGESLKAIGRAFGKPSSSIYFLVAPHGGFVLRAAWLQAGIDAGGTRGDFQRRYGASIGTIDRQVARPSPSTVSREMSRMAAMIVTERRLRTRMPGRELKLANNPRLRRAVAGSSDWIVARADSRLAEENTS